MTEAMLVKSDFYLAPVRPDYLSIRGLQVLQTLKKYINKQKRGTFPTNIGTLITMKPNTSVARENAQLIGSGKIYKAFSTAIPHSPQAIEAAHPSPDFRGFRAKYPGVLGKAIERFAAEFWMRLS